MILSRTKHSIGAYRGFTLIEICVVIALLAILATFSWQANKMVNTRKMNETAKLQIEQMTRGLNAYRQDMGDQLPAGDGDEWSSHVLYSVLYCDENNDGEPDMDPKTGEPRIPYCEELSPGKRKGREIINGIPVRMAMVQKPGKRNQDVKRLVIMDPWGIPYRYRLGYEMRDPESKHRGKGINPDFDIFSLGPDTLGNGRTNRGDDEDNISNVRSWD